MRPIVIPLGVRGRVRWGVLDERGRRVPVVARYASGRVALLPGGHWSPNLITNAGMNAFATTDSGWVGMGSTGGGSVRRWGRIGTGSGSPAFTDTSLDNQVQTSEAATPFTSDAFSAVEDTDEITLQFLARRTFVMTAERNLTEYGFSGTEAGDLYVRELFRDSGGTPVTITVPEGKTLRLDHTYDVTVDLSLQQGQFDVDEFDAVGDPVGSTTLDYDARVWSRQGSAGTPTQNGRNIASALRDIVMAGPAWGGAASAFLSSQTTNPDITSGTFLGGTPSGYTERTSFALPAGSIAYSKQAYTAGSHERVWHATINPAQLNFAWRGWGYRRSATFDGESSQGGGFIVAFRNSGSFTKADTHTLRWSLKYAWARG